MKKYTIHFHGQKIRAKKDLFDTATAEMVEEWEDTIQSNGLPAIWHLTDFAYPGHGVAGVHFFHVPSVPGLFRSIQIEDNKGFPTSKGNYLAQFDVQITCSRNSPSINVGTLGCPPEPKENL